MHLFNSSELAFNSSFDKFQETSYNNPFNKCPELFSHFIKSLFGFTLVLKQVARIFT